MSSASMNRREILQKIAITASGLVLTRGIASGVPTPAQTEGPFYPIKDQADKGGDMTQVTGHTNEALGTRVFLTGTVLDDKTKKPIIGALVEFWQACHTGKYDHPDDPNTADLDPDFQYWAQVGTDKSGRFSLKTIKPGAYPAAPGWIRPPHIHVKVHAKGYPSLTTQLYFEGDELNAKDKILLKIPSAKRDLVMVKLNPRSADKKSFEGDWIIYLSSERSASANSTPEID